LSGFADPWEHVRLLSDGDRNAAMLELLRRRAPGAVVVEIGCGTGLWSCVAARLGATRVVAVEQTVQVEAARELVSANRLEDRVTVHHAAFEALPPEPADLVFSELLNADPFAEGLLEVSRAARPWLREGGHLAPCRLEVWCALVEEGASATEHDAALGEIARIGAAHGLDVGAIRDVLDDPGPYVYLADGARLVSRPACVCATDLRRVEEPEGCEVEVEVEERAVAGGVAVWFRAELDDGLVLDNAPGASGHWGLQIVGWPQPIEVVPGRVRLWAEPDGSGFEITPSPR